MPGAERNLPPNYREFMMNEQEKAAYILGLKKAIEQIEEEAELSEMEHSDQPKYLNAAVEALRYAIVLIQDEIAMTDGTRETKDI